MSNESDLTPEELRQMKRVSEVEADLKKRNAFAEEARERGLLYKDDIDCYVDEKGNLLDAYGNSA